MYRINNLIKLDRRLYHTNDLGVLWSTANKNTLYTTISRYVQKGILIPVYKGLYATVPLDQIDPYELGVAIIHRFAYVSCESVLAREGIIAQTTYAHTFVCDVSKKVTTGSRAFVYRKLKDEFLHNPAGITSQGSTEVASLERAVADMLYFNPRYHLDGANRVDWGKVKQMQKEVGYI